MAEKFKGNFEFVKCNLCGSANFEKINSVGRYNEPANVVLCKDCGLGYLNSRWDKASYSKYYFQAYDANYRSEFQTLEKLELNSPKYNNIHQIVKRFGEYIAKMPSEINILEIGSAEGLNLDYLKREKFPNANLFAIEPSKGSREKLDLSGIKVVSDDVDNEWWKGYQANFDIVIMRHVLEHFLDPMEALKTTKKVLKPNGLVYIAVPNSLKPRKPIRDYFFRAAHTYYFNHYSLVDFLRKCGFKILSKVEGDDYNKTELFFIATLEENSILDAPISNSFQEQREVFQTLLKIEDSFLYGLRKKIRSIKNKFT
jgi:SAM-dependent methyltransferase